MCTPRASASTSSGCAYSRSIRSRTRRSRARSRRRCAEADLLATCESIRREYVVSTTLTDDDLVDNWDETTILRSLDDVAALKETEGGPIIIHGSATLARTLSDTGLNDRYHLLVFPVLLGAGKGMVTDTDKDKAEAGVGRERTYANSIQKLVCDVVNELAARLGRLYELTKLASAAVKAEALGYSPKVIERSLLVLLEHVSLPVRCGRTSPTSSSVTAVLTNSYLSL
jgi:hypothetical protein